MSQPIVYVALQQFCETDARPRQVLLDAGCEVRQNTLGRRMRREELLVALREVAAVVAGVEPYDAELLRALPCLRCISRCGAGTDAIDLEAVGRRGVAIYTTPDEVVEPVAQMTVTMILALARNIPFHVCAAHEGQWVKQTGVALSEWTIGLIGFGRIGQAVERYLRVFAPRVLIADPAVRPEALPRGVEWRELEPLLAEADVISLHASRPKDAGPLIGRKELSRMKPGSRLVNTARGYLVDDAAVAEALHSGHLAGAAFDVYGQEPYTGPLARLPQVLCTPHVASLTRASRAAMELRCAQNVVGFFAQQRQWEPVATTQPSERCPQRSPS